MSRTRRDLALLSDPAFRRFAVEVVVVMLVTLLTVEFLVAPWLRDTLPGLFRRPLGSPERGDPPRTALGWLGWLAMAVVAGGFAYWRVTRTALGRAAWTAARAVSDPTADRDDRE